MTWLYLTGASILCFVALNLLQRVIAVESKYPRAMTFVFNSAAALISILIFFATGSHTNFKLPQDYLAYVFLLLAAVFYGIFERVRFSFSKELDASVSSIIGNLQVLVAFVAASILYSEEVTLQKVIGGILIVSALSIIYYKKKSKATLRGIMLAVVGSIAVGLGWSLDKKGAGYFNVGSYNILIWTLPLILIYLPSIKFKEMKTEVKTASWIIILKERKDIFKKIIAGILAFAGVYFLLF